MGNSLFSQLTTYEIKHLTTHLEKSGQLSGLARLLSLETENKLNAWFEKKDAEDSIDEYLTDIQRLWNLNSRELQLNGKDAGAEQICGLTYCLLITGSLHSLVGNIPTNLLTQLVKNGIWSKNKAIKYAFQVRNPNERRDAVMALMPLLDDFQRRTVYETIQEEEHDDVLKRKLLATIISFLPDTLPERIIDDYFSISRDRDKADAVNFLCDFVPDRLVNYLFEKLILLQGNSPKTEIVLLKKIIPGILTPEQLEVVITRIRNIIDEPPLAELLQLIAPKLPEEKLREMMIRSDFYFSNKERHQEVRSCFAVQLAESGQEGKAFTILSQISNDAIREKALSRIIILLVKKGKRSVGLKKIGGIKAPDVLSETVINITPFLKEAQVEGVLKIARTIWDDRYRTTALLALATRLNRRRAGTIAKAARKAMEGVRHVSTNKYFSDSLHSYDSAVVLALGEIIPPLARLGFQKMTIDIFEDIVNERVMMSDHKDRDKLYIFLGRVIQESAPFLKKSAIERVLKLLNKLSIGKAKGIAMAGLAPRLPFSLLKESWENANEFEEMESLAPFIPEGLMHNFIIQVLPDIIYDYHAQYINGISPYLSTSLTYEALKATKLIHDEYAIARVLTLLAVFAGENSQVNIWHTALEMVENMHKLGDGVKRGVLEKIISYLDLSSCKQAISIADKLYFENHRTEVLVTLLSKMVERKWAEEAFNFAHELLDEDGHRSFLRKTIGYLPGYKQKQVLNDALAFDDYEKELLIEGFQAIDDDVFPELFALIASIESDELRGGVIVYAGVYVKGKFAQRMLTLIDTISPPFLRIRAYASIVVRNRYLVNSDWINNSLLIVKKPNKSKKFDTEADLESESDRQEAIESLGPLLTEAQLLDVLTGILPGLGLSAQAKVLSHLARFMTLPVLKKAIGISEDMSEFDRSEALVGLMAQYANVGFQQQVFSWPYSFSISWHKVDFYKLLDEHVIRDKAEVILEQISFYPMKDQQARSAALCFIIPYLNNSSLIKKAIPVIRQISYKFHREKPLEVLAGQVCSLHADEIICVWKELFPWPNKAGRADLLFDIAATRQLYAALLQEHSIEMIINSIRSVSTWWK